ncbi:DNA polymerase III subunit beta [Clostridium magnum]|uniref:Beta sliding clamp n=1 Tax=Clostridium magnum DSM 2767 TaxID=1121326 RepID=A0A162QT51_9CLOT|nr:DNA polymerase III subunit beta [Clostridium magnum]KZL88927.1 DNA polymerase III subunit beta [Clostridium magnum DSM 2767]SHI53828.1 DNA polymerase-3 subunit beta [Clostridium magnum DSM 2767]
MKINILKQELVEALNAIGRVMGSNVAIPLLKGFVISAKGDQITMFATNTDISTKAIIKAEIFEEGEIVIADGKLFNDIIRKLPKDEVKLEVKEGNIEIKSGRSKSKLQIIGTEDFPKAPTFKEDKSFKIKGSTLKELISKSVFAIATDEVRPVLTGVYFEVKSGLLNLIALDGIRLSHTYTTVSDEAEGLSAIVPGKGAIEISKAIEEDEEITLAFSSNHCLFKTDSKEIVVRLLDGEYIKYSSIMPTEFSKTITTGKKEIVDAIERAAIVAKEGSNPIILLIENGKLNITAKSQLGCTSEDITVEESGADSLEIAFNNKILLEGLKAASSEKVKLQFNSSTSPCLIVPSDDSDEAFEYLALPVRIRS